jgi:hypothetical protein
MRMDYHVIESPTGYLLAHFTWRGEPVWTHGLGGARHYSSKEPGSPVFGDLVKASKGYCLHPGHRPFIRTGTLSF